MTIFEIRYSDFQSEPFSEQRGSASGPLAAPLGLVDNTQFYVNRLYRVLMGKTQFLKKSNTHIMMRFCLYRIINEKKSQG